MIVDLLCYIYVVVFEFKGVIDGWVVGLECLGEVLCGYGCGFCD